MKLAIGRNSLVLYEVGNRKEFACLEQGWQWEGIRWFLTKLAMEGIRWS